MKIKFDTEEDLVGFIKSSSMPWGDRLSPVAAITFAIDELNQFEFMRSDLMIKLESQILALQDIHERMTLSYKQHESVLREIQAKNTTQEQPAQQP